MASNSRVILVTGSNTGIGYELVRLLASKGHTVYLSSRNEQSGQNAVKKLKEEHSLNVKYVRLDVTDEQSVTSAKDIIEEAEGKLDALVNNAGIVIFSSMPSQLDINQVNEILNTNYLGVIRVTTAFIPLIRKAGNGVILNVSSEVGSHTAQSQLAERFLADFGYVLRFEGYLELVHYFVGKRIEGGRGGRSATVGAEVLLPWVLLSPGEDKTGIFYGHRTNGNVEEIPW
ncbi:short chain dehydrogenase [Moniliophthora roreri MCA 2997]|uniref:Short chain dehydrogenase n=1 Tax=Moniliophthora roreri (strain MCA 2997) TaxID=1381753 RepID=V2XN95_MONRO|nr:short chain dehydrogenase [Moniliophthora roreri MCA 2997]